MLGLLRRFTVVSLLVCGTCAQAQSIYTCTDSKGRRLTSDRPIAECVDREQKELNPSGTVRRKLGPSLTSQEAAVEDEKLRKAAEDANRQAEEKRRERALLTRYPEKSAHDQQRLAALALADEAISSASKNADDLQAQRKRLETDLEFYKKDPSKVPPKLRRQIEEADSHLEAQRRFVANQVSEKNRINARFDEELVILRQLWTQRVKSPAATASNKS
jgi:hypothetical protein